MQSAPALALLLLAACGSQAPAAPPEGPPNVLFIAVDDLRPALGCYGDARAHSPRIDALAASGLVFEHAYCVQAHCAPSRASVLTGLRPKPTTLGNIVETSRRLSAGVRTLPELFQARGYTTISLGKVDHGYGGEPDPRGWSETPWRPEGRLEHYASPETEAKIEAAAKELGLEGPELLQLHARFVSWEAPDVEDGALSDGVLAERAIAELGRLREERFFLTVGFVRPHLPLVAPKRYWDLYPEDGLAPDPFDALPAGVEGYVAHPSAELRSYFDVPDEGPFGEELERRLVRGYYACVSYVDAQIGRVLDALDALGLAERTVVVLWSDHGYELGDHGLWGKHTNYERAVRVPLVVRAPGVTRPGARVEEPVELLDLLPTLAELCGLEPSKPPAGRSLVPELRGKEEDPDAAAFTMYPGSGSEGAGIVGYAIRTPRYRLIEWLRGDALQSRELYDYQARGEASNLAGREETSALEDELSKRLRAVWMPRAGESAAGGDGR